MPTLASIHPHDENPARWRACLQRASEIMVASGWNPRARKFDEVKRRKALQLWRVT